MKLKLAALCLMSLMLPAHAADPPVQAGTENLPPAWPRPGSVTLVENDRGAAFNVSYPMGQATPAVLEAMPVRQACRARTLGDKSDA